MNNAIDKNFAYYDAERIEVVNFIPTNIKSLLDIGCGNGKFGAKLKSINQDLIVWGVEPNPSSANNAREVLDNLFEGEFLSSKIVTQKKDFDCITFNDVLEHMYNPKEVLIDCKCLLSQNGLIIASIPNIMFFDVFFWSILYNEDWKYESEGILDFTHLRFFTKKSMTNLFIESNYEIIDIVGINPSKSRYFKLLNFLLFNRLKNWKFQQYVITAKLYE